MCSKMQDFSFEFLFRGVCSGKSKCVAFDKALFLPLRGGNLRNACIYRNAPLSVLIHEKANGRRKIEFDGLFTRLRFVRVVIDGCEPTKVRFVHQLRSLDLGTVLYVTVPFLVGNGLAVTRVSHQFHGVGNDGLAGVPIPCSSLVGYRVAKPFEARLGGILHHRKCHVGTVRVYLTELEITAIEILVDAVVVEFQHAPLSVLIHEKANGRRKIEFDGLFTRLHFVRVSIRGVPQHLWSDL